jgi:CHCH domain
VRGKRVSFPSVMFLCDNPFMMCGYIPSPNMIWEGTLEGSETGGTKQFVIVLGYLRLILLLYRLDDINKHCLTEFRKHWTCLENNNQQLWQCRPAEWKLNKCVFDSLVCHHGFLLS